MCTAQLSMGAQGFGAGMSAVGAFFNASGQQRSLRHQANMAEINARIMDGNARNAIRAGTFEESKVKLHGAQAKGATIAKIASSGVDLGSNTAVARLTGNDVITEVDAQTVRSNALREAWGYRFEAGNQRRSADAYRASASSISPFLAGATSLISSAGQVARSWYVLNKEGAFDSNSSGGNASPANDTDALLSNWSFTGEGNRSTLGSSPEGHYGVYTHDDPYGNNSRPGLRWGRGY